MTKQLIEEINRLTLEMSHAGMEAGEAEDDNGALGALVDLPRMLDDVRALHTTLVLMVRRGK